MASIWHADIVILTALEKEFEAMARSLGKTSMAISHSGQQYRTCSINGNVIAIPMACGPGQLNAASATVKVLNDFTPRWILLVGIAGKLKSDIALGDLLISTQVIDYELAKFREIDAIDKAEIRHVGYQCSARLLDAAKAANTGKSTNKWTTYITTRRPDSRSSSPKIHFGTVFCGNKVVAAPGFAEELRMLHPAALGLEMEAVGITAMLKNVANPPDFLSIKSAVDNCDGSKNDLWHPYGAETAARFCHAILKAALKLTPIPIDYDALKSLLQARLAAGYRMKMNEAEKKMLEAYAGWGVDIGACALKDKFEADISSGGNFLLLAKPAFQSASKFYATSIDTVSGFWIDPKKKQAAYEYLKEHKQGAHRLFVFHDRETLYKYSEVLDAHANEYKQVYYCTGLVYDKILRSISRDSNERAQRDFAVLDCSTSERDALYFAELDEDRYIWKAIQNEETSGNIIVRSFIDYFSRWSKLKAGEGHEGVFKWRIGAWRDKEEWAKTLDAMFGTQTLDAYHLVYIRPDHNARAIDEVRKLLSELKRAIDKDCDGASGPTLSQRYRIKDIWFGESFKVIAVDGRFGGELRRGHSVCCSDYAVDFILAMKFDSSEDLERFYRDQKHSEIRQRLYQALDPKIKVIFDQAHGLQNQPPASGKNPAHIVKALYELIEDRESAYLNRFDFRSGELTHHMVKHVTPVEFSPP